MNTVRATKRPEGKKKKKGNGPQQAMDIWAKRTEPQVEKEEKRVQEVFPWTGRKSFKKSEVRATQRYPNLSEVGGQRTDIQDSGGLSL